jgi:exopolysaccharide production protein ExoQ
VTAPARPAPRVRLGPRVLPTGWVAAVAVSLMVASEYSVRRRAQGASLSGTADNAVVIELAVYAAASAFMLLAIVRPPSGRRAAPVLVALWGFTLAMLLAACWSPFPRLAIARGVQLVIVATLGHLVAEHATPQALSRLCHTFAAVMVLSVGIGIVLPFGSFPGAAGRFSWLYVHPNVAGGFLAIGATVTLALLQRRRRGDLLAAPWRPSTYTVLLLIEIGGLLATRSRGSMTALALGLGAVLVAGARGRKRLDVVLVTASMTTIVWLLAATDLVAFWDRGDSAEELGSLNSRTEVWGQAWQLFGQRPLLGHGFMSARGVFLDTFGLGGAHNAFVEVLVNSGVFGTAFWIALLVLVVVGAVRVARAGLPDGPLLVGVVGALVGTAMTAGGLGQAATVQNVWLFLVAGWVVAAPRLEWRVAALDARAARPATPLLASAPPAVRGAAVAAGTGTTRRTPGSPSG